MRPHAIAGVYCKLPATKVPQRYHLCKGTALPATEAAQAFGASPLNAQRACFSEKGTVVVVVGALALAALRVSPPRYEKRGSKEEYLHVTPPRFARGVYASRR